MKHIITFIFLVASITLFSQDDFLSNLPKEKKMALLKLYVSHESFLANAPDVRNAKETMYLFFDQPIYEKLKGNILVGWSYSDDFVLDGKEIGLDEIRGISEAKVFGKDFFKLVLDGFKADGIVFNKESKYRLGYGIVAFQDQLSKDSHYGLLIEMYIKNTQTGKVFYERFQAASSESFIKAQMKAVRMMNSNILFYQAENINNLVKKAKK